MRQRARLTEIRRRLYEILEQGVVGDPAGRLVGRLIVLLIVVNLAAVTLESVPALHARYAAWFTAIEIVSLLVFTLEYGLRIWVAGAAMHLAERLVQPDKFGTIPDAMWWAIVTLGTIGYGDLVPLTPLGRVIGAVTIFAGLIMIALPVGIVATAFADQVHRREFI